MRLLLAVIILAPLMIAPAAAQDPTIMPRTVPFTDKDGKQIGTATFALGRLYIRDNKGELIAQIIVDRDGTQTLLDPNGKVLDRQTVPEKK